MMSQKIFFIIILAALPLHAQIFDGGLTDSIFEEGSSIKTLSLGKTGIGGSIGLDSMALNPAGLAPVFHSGFALGYSNLFEGASLQELSWAQSGAGPYGFGLSVIRYEFPEIVTRDASNNVTGTTADQKTAVKAGFGVSLSPHVYFGGALKHFEQTILDQSSSLLDADLGFQWKFSSPASLGMTINNIFQSPLQRDGGSDDLPRTLRIGLTENFRSQFTLNVENVWRNGDDPVWKAGLEYNPWKTLSLRAGWDGAKPSLGVGLIMDRSKRSIGINYAAVSTNDLGLTHRIGITWNYGPDVASLSRQRQDWKPRFFGSNTQKNSLASITSKKINPNKVSASIFAFADHETIVPENRLAAGFFAEAIKDSGLISVVNDPYFLICSPSTDCFKEADQRTKTRLIFGISVNSLDAGGYALTASIFDQNNGQIFVEKSSLIKTINEIKSSAEELAINCLLDWQRQP